MEIGKFKLAKADLVRPPRKPIQEQIIPQEKPYTKEVFQTEVEPFIKGFIGGFPKNEMTMKLQSILDKAVERGALSVDEGTTYMRDRKQQLLDFVEQNPGETLPSLTRENFAFGTEKPITPNNDLGNIQVENLDKPFNESLEESTMGPGGYPMTASLLNPLNIPKNVKTAVNLIEAGEVGIRDAIKITKDFLNRRDPYIPTGIAGDKKDYTKEKDFLQVFNKLKNKFFQGDVTKTNRALGTNSRLAKDIERRVIQAEKGTGVTGQDDRFLFYEPSVPEPVKGMSWPDTTTLMKKDPDKFLSLKVDKENPNKFLDKKSLANYLGIKFEKDDLGKLTKYGKIQSDAFMTRLTNLGVKKTNQGLFDTNDVINKLVKASEKKLVKGERKSEMGAGRYGLEKKFDPELFSERERVKRIVKKSSQGLDFYIPRGVDDLGHPYSITKSENKYKKLFKDSNMNRLNTLVYQDPLINVELFKTSGYESKHDKMFDILSKIQNKKVTPEIQNQLLKIKKDMNDNYNYVTNIIKNPKELIKYLPENTDPKYVNYLSKSHVDRVQKIDINIPKVGETFKSKDVFADMSTVNPKYIVGYVNNINPNAKKFKDLSLAEQELYRKNLLMQNSEIVSDFIKKAGATGEEAEEIREAITMSKGGRVGFKKGTPKKSKYRSQLLNILKNVGKKTGKVFTPFGSVTAGLGYTASGYAEDDPSYSLASANLFLPEITGAASKAANVTSKTGRFLLNPFTAISPGAATLVPKIMTKAAIPLTIGGGIIDIAKASQPDYLLDKKTDEPKAFDREDASFVMPTIIDANEQVSRFAKEKGISYRDAFKELFKDKTFREGIQQTVQKYAIGGRVNFADGPEDPSKRKFMKIMGGLASLPIVGRFFDIAPVAYNAAEDVGKIIKGAPPHFVGLVNKIRALGKIVDPKKLLLPSEQKRYSNVYDYGDYRMYERPDGGIEISKDKLIGTDYGEAKVSEEYMSYNPKVPKYNKKGEKIPDEYTDEYEEYTAYADSDGKMKDVQDGVLDDTINEGTYSKEELEQLIIEQVEQNLKKGKK